VVKSGIQPYLAGKDAVPETVHHAMVMVDPASEEHAGWAKLEPPALTDNLHTLDNVGTGGLSRVHFDPIPLSSTY
jgi:hypothetical protein